MAKLFYNGTIHSMCGGKAEALLEADGRIAALGEAEALLQLRPDAERIDLAGGTLTPGLIDGHGHFFGAAMALLKPGLEKADTMEALLLAVKRTLENTPGDGLVQMRDYDLGALHPSGAELDRISGGRPLLLIHQSGHMGVFNSAAA